MQPAYRDDQAPSAPHDITAQKSVEPLLTASRFGESRHPCGACSIRGRLRTYASAGRLRKMAKE